MNYEIGEKVAILMQYVSKVAVGTVEGVTYSKEFPKGRYSIKLNEDFLLDSVDSRRLLKLEGSLGKAMEYLDEMEGEVTRVHSILSTNITDLMKLGKLLDKLIIAESPKELVGVKFCHPDKEGEWKIVSYSEDDEKLEDITIERADLVTTTRTETLPESKVRGYMVSGGSQFRKDGKPIILKEYYKELEDKYEARCRDFDFMQALEE